LQEESIQKGKMKQTAVDWLFTQLWETPKDKLTWHSILEEAKLLEQEQIREAHFSGSGNNSFEALSLREKDVSNSYENSRQYYKETYEK
jgi:hypothetical protein